ncbi:hypothetical protein TPA0905_38080 [Streptomyces olivaceus]|nr:hypothetical protein TPA0905_38080 [Streptomyces olivaceus]
MVGGGEGGRVVVMNVHPFRRVRESGSPGVRGFEDSGIDSGIRGSGIRAGRRERAGAVVCVASYRGANVGVLPR